MMRAACFLLPLLLCACTDEMSRVQCQRAAVEEIRILDTLIAEAEADSARGYSAGQQDLAVLDGQLCGNGTYCTDMVILTENPVAIDPATEDRKLAGLREARQRLIPHAKVEYDKCNLR